MEEMNVFYNRIKKLYSQGLTDQLISEVEKAWPSFKDECAIPEYADCCRLAALAYAKQGNLPQLHLWRSRALSRFVLSGNYDGIASLFVSFAMGQKGNPEIALGILDEMELLISNKPSESARLTSHSVQRLLHEYKAYVYAFLLNDFNNAINEYEKASNVSGADFRGFLKAKLEIALYKYFISKNELQKNEAIDQTRKIINNQLEKSDHDEFEIKRIAEHNLSLMSTGEIFDPKKFKFYSTL